MVISYLVGIFANSLFLFSNYIIGMWACAGDMETFFSCLIIFFDLGWRPVLDLKLFKRFSAFYPLFFLSFSFGVYHIDRKCGC